MSNIFETLIGEEDKLNKQNEYLLASSSGSKKIKIDSKTVSVSKKEEERVSNEELEYAYRTDSFIFNAVNVAVQMIMSAGHRITAKKASVRKHFETFVEDISKVGADTTWIEILTRIFQDSYIYRGSWNELVWNVGDTKIVDLKTLNPKELFYVYHTIV